MISLFELGHVDPIPINFVLVPPFMCRVYIYMEVPAHARCKPCHASDLSSFLSCWTMPGLGGNAREGGGQWAEEEVAAGH